MYGGYDIYQTCPSGTQPYIIRAGDTYYSLAIRFNTTVAAIMAANPGVDPNRLMIGQQICIPGAPMPGECPAGTQPYIIRAGDTFYSLAIRFNTTVAAIMAANPGVDPNRLMIGQRICIPGAPIPGQCPAGTDPYVIKAGDTIFSLAARFNTTVEAILAANPGIDPNRLMIGQQICIPRPGVPPCPGGQYYTIRSGDTLYALANRFNVTVAAIIQANPGIDPMSLRVGQIICIPAPAQGSCPSGTSEYTIQAGDTFFSIARRFNISVDSLMQANPGVDPDALQIGQKICVPMA
ncbi:MAG TPA: LysM peptidoglycan-binding domain-containing protein [Clostridiales bacterium]|nr:LysM peptidoglycan-binding domain-containing protein [Clostridiales bacterium]